MPNGATGGLVLVPGCLSVAPILMAAGYQSFENAGPSAEERLFGEMFGIECRESATLSCPVHGAHRPQVTLLYDP